MYNTSMAQYTTMNSAFMLNLQAAFKAHALNSIEIFQHIQYKRQTLSASFAMVSPHFDIE